MDVGNLLITYSSKKKEIKQRLKEFKELYNKGSHRELFAELAFCLCTPQSRATVCDRAVKDLVDTRVLYNGNEKQIKEYMQGVRFHNNKAKYIVEARQRFTEDGSLMLKDRLNTRDVPALRDWLVEHVKGLGYKEASHFLRNIGQGDRVAILDRHILKNLKHYRVINEIPQTISKKKYLEIERKMKKFSDRINISLPELDLVFWSEETGKIFK